MKLLLLRQFLLVPLRPLVSRLGISPDFGKLLVEAFDLEGAIDALCGTVVVERRFVDNVDPTFGIAVAAALGSLDERGHVLRVLLDVGEAEVTETDARLGRGEVGIAWLGRFD